MSPVEGNIQQEPVKDQFTLIQIRYDVDPITGAAGTTLGLTNSNEDLTTEVGVFLAYPALEVEEITTTGTLEDPAVEFHIPITQELNAFANLVTSSTATPLFYVTIWEYYPETLQIRTLAVGEAARVTKNKDGKEGILGITVIGEKRKLDKLAGVVALDDCDNSFGDARCQKAFTISETGTITAVNDFVITITGLAAQNDLVWNKGYIEIGGSRIGISQWVQGTDFIMREIAPQSWVGQNPRVVSGCDQRVTSCETVHQNLGRFNGVGLFALDYNPNFENPNKDDEFVDVTVTTTTG